MDVLPILNRARRLTSTDENQYTNDEWVEDINFLYQELCNEIVREVWEDYFWDYVKWKTVVGQSEYDIKDMIDWDDVYDIKKIKAFFIKYDSTYTNYKRVTYRDFEDYLQGREELETSQNFSNPIYCIKDESTFLFPAPVEVVKDGLYYEIIYTPLDLAIDSVQADIKIPREYHYILAEGMKIYAHESNSRFNEANQARQSFEQEKRKMIEFLQERKQWDIIEELPNLTHLD